MIPKNNKDFFNEIQKNDFFPDDFEQRIINELPKFRIIDKAERCKKKFSIMWIFNGLSELLKKITGNKIDLQFMDRTTTQGYTIYIGNDWEWRSDFSKYQLIRHEIVHMLQWRRYSIIYSFTYAFVLPAGLSMRAWWEYQAFKESISCYVDTAVKMDDAWISHIAKTYTSYLIGIDYLYAAPFCKNQIYKGFKNHAKKIAKASNNEV